MKNHMKKENLFFPNRFLWVAGAGGFAVGFLASLAGGNLLFTSFKRGFIGFVLIFLLFWILQSLSLVGGTSAPAVQPQADADRDPKAGTRFDVSLPAEHFESPPSPGDFQPWIIGDRDQAGEERIEKVVQAVRAMKE